MWTTKNNVTKRHRSKGQVKLDSSSADTDYGQGAVKCRPTELEKQSDSTSKTAKEKKAEWLDPLLYIPPMISERQLPNVEGNGSDARKRNRGHAGEQGRKKAKRPAVRKALKNSATVEIWTITRSANAGDESLGSSGIANACTERASIARPYGELREAEEIPPGRSENGKRTRAHFMAETNLKDFVTEKSFRTKLSAVSEELRLELHTEMTCETKGKVSETGEQETCAVVKQDFKILELPPRIYERNNGEKMLPVCGVQSSEALPPNSVVAKDEQLREPSHIRRQHSGTTPKIVEKKYACDEHMKGLAEVIGPTTVDDFRCTLHPTGSAPALKRSVLRTSGEMPLFTLAGFIHASLGLTESQVVTIWCCRQALKGCSKLRNIAKDAWRNERCPIALEYSISEAQNGGVA